MPGILAGRTARTLARLFRRAVFNPASVAGLHAWYKADAITGKVDGNAIAQWDDSSGNARHAVQATGANQPIYKVNILNGKPGLLFDGLAKYLEAVGVNVAQPTTIFAVVQNDQGGAGTWKIFDGVTARQLIQKASSAWQFFATNLVVGAGATTSPTLMSAVFNGAGSVLYKNGVQNAAGDAGAAGLNDLVIGVGNLKNTNFWSGYIFELLIYSGAKTTAERASIERSLGNKWGIVTA